MALLALYWGIMIVSYVIASKLRDKKEKFAFTEELTNIVIYLIVLLMGLRMGSNEEVTSSLGTIGVQSVIITIFTVAGSMGFVFVARKLMKLDKQGMSLNDAAAVAEEKEEGENGSGLRFTLMILIFVVAGMLLGYFGIPALYDDLNYFQDISGDWLVVGICVLLGLAGFNLGIAGNIFEHFKGVGYTVAVIPVAAVAGSFILAALYSLIASIFMDDGLSVREVHFEKSEYFPPSNTLMLNFSCVAETEDLSGASEEEIDYCRWFSFEEAVGAIARDSLAERFLQNFLRKRRLCHD